MKFVQPSTRGPKNSNHVVRMMAIKTTARAAASHVIRGMPVTSPRRPGRPRQRDSSLCSAVCCQGAADIDLILRDVTLLIAPDAATDSCLVGRV